MRLYMQDHSQSYYFLLALQNVLASTRGATISVTDIIATHRKDGDRNTEKSSTRESMAVYFFYHECEFLYLIRTWNWILTSCSSTATPEISFDFGNVF